MTKAKMLVRLAATLAVAALALAAVAPSSAAAARGGGGRSARSLTRIDDGHSATKAPETLVEGGSVGYHPVQAPLFDSGALSLRAECPHSTPQYPMFSCASHVEGSAVDWPCIRDVDLCDGFNDCPRAEDEHPVLCMFYLAQHAQMKAMRRLLAKHMLASEDTRHRDGKTRYFEIP